MIWSARNSSGWEMMPAPRPASASSACSNTSTSQPSRASRLAASSPPSEPPITNARMGSLQFAVDSLQLLPTDGCQLPTLSRRFCGGIVQFDRDLARVLDEHLVQAERGNGALAERDLVPAELLAHVGETGCGERHVVHRAGALERFEVAVAEIFLEAFRVVEVHADDVNHAVGLGVRPVVVEPQARKVELRPVADLEAHDLGVEPARSFYVEGANRVVVKFSDRHGSARCEKAAWLLRPHEMGVQNCRV